MLVLLDCFSTEDYNEWVNKHYPNDNDDDEKIIPDWFHLNLPYCDECEKYIEVVDGVCSNYRSHRLLVTCNYCQKDFKTFNDRQVRCVIGKVLILYIFAISYILFLYSIHTCKQ